MQNWYLLVSLMQLQRQFSRKSSNTMIVSLSAVDQRRHPVRSWPWNVTTFRCIAKMAFKLPFVLKHWNKLNTIILKYNLSKLYSKDIHCRFLYYVHIIYLSSISKWLASSITYVSWPNLKRIIKNILCVLLQTVHYTMLLYCTMYEEIVPIMKYH